MNLTRIEESLGYVFTDKAWLKQALTHPSVDQKKQTNLNYERLEYLGDAVLELVVSRALFSAYPKADEGQLTQMRASIVSRQHLAERCEALSWGEELHIGPQLEASGGRQTRSVLANTFETVIGAVMMDSNYNAACKISLHLLQKSIDDAAQVVQQANPKGSLIELLQTMGTMTPTYEVTAMGENGTAPFRATAHWGELLIGEGEGPSKRSAEVAAAADALQRKLWEKA